MQKSLLRRKAASSRRSEVVKAMAHPTRLLFMELLMEGERCVCDLTEAADCDITTVSKHLSLMKSAGLLVSEKRGLQVFYRIACPCFSDFFRCIDLISSAQCQRLRCAC